MSRARWCKAGGGGGLTARSESSVSAQHRRSGHGRHDHDHASRRRRAPRGSAPPRPSERRRVSTGFRWSTRGLNGMRMVEVLYTSTSTWWTCGAAPPGTHIACVRVLSVGCPWRLGLNSAASHCCREAFFEMNGLSTALSPAARNTHVRAHREVAQKFVARALERAACIAKAHPPRRSPCTHIRALQHASNNSLRVVGAPPCAVAHVCSRCTRGGALAVSADAPAA